MVARQLPSCSAEGPQVHDGMRAVIGEDNFTAF
jgi:hypothetical protein